MKRCINCQNEIATFVETHFEGFHFIKPPREFQQSTYFFTYDRQHGKLTGSFYPFVRESDTGCFHHFHISRGFLDETIYLRVESIYTSYLKYLWDIAPCTRKIPANAMFSRLPTLPEKAAVTSPWVITENDRDSLRQGLAQLKTWCIDCSKEIALSFEKQQGWIDKQNRSYRMVRRFMGDHMAELSETAILDLYRCVDQLADEYNAFYKGEYQKSVLERVWFQDYCYGKLPPTFNRWVDAIQKQLKKARVVEDCGAGILELLYFLHDSQKASYPNILTSMPWKIEQTKAKE